MPDADTLLATIGLAACGVLLVRMAIGQRRRARLDAALRRIVQAARTRLRGRTPGRARRSDEPRRDADGHAEHAAHAEHEARDLIDRARRGRPRVERDGNVFRPRSFNGGRPDDATDGRHRRDH
jgi:hypothetical protein